MFDRQKEYMEQQTKSYQDNRCFVLYQKLEALQAKLKKVEAERDVLLAYLADESPCEACKYWFPFDGSECCAEADGECPDCNVDCNCKGCLNGSKWEWRGVQEGE